MNIEKARELVEKLKGCVSWVGTENCGTYWMSPAKCGEAFNLMADLLEHEIEKKHDIEWLIGGLENALKCNSDAEKAHIKADAALIEYIGDERVSALFKAVNKWYS